MERGKRNKEKETDRKDRYRWVKINKTADSDRRVFVRQLNFTGDIDGE